MKSIDEIFDRGDEFSVAAYMKEFADLQPFIFLLNVTGIELGGPVELATGFLLRLATPAETACIRDTLSALYGKNVPSYVWDSQYVPQGPGPGGVLKVLHPENWRYHIVELTGDDDVKFEQALMLASSKIRVGFTLLKGLWNKQEARAITHRPKQLFQDLRAAGRRLTLHTVTDEDAKEIRHLFETLKTHDETLCGIDRPMSLLTQLHDLPARSPLRVLGLFAILESMLTHKPMPEDRYDSITRQITQKLALLQNRWPMPLDYSKFGGASHKKIWAAMYSYRSTIAHGDTADFRRGLSVLERDETADRLIEEAVANLLRFALAEPRLLADLRNC